MIFDENAKQCHSSTSGLAYIGIVAAAADDPTDDFNYYVELFTNKYNLKASQIYRVPVDLTQPQQAYNMTVVEKIKRLTGIYFAGGDQERIEQTFFDKNHKMTPVLAAIKSQYESDKLVVAGSSAGTTIQQVTPMIDGGLSYQGLTNGVFDHLDKALPDNVGFQWLSQLTARHLSFHFNFLLCFR